jgi:hypothetical protein
MLGRSLGFYLTLLSLLGAALIVIRFLVNGLYRRYRVFFSYLAFRILMFAGALPFDLHSDEYAYYFLATEALVLVFYLFVVRELVGLVLEKYTGLQSLGRWFMYAGIGVSAAVSLAALLPKITPQIPFATRRMAYVFAVDRGVTFSLVIFLLLLLVFLSRYPAPLGRNILVHAGLFTVFFLSSTLTTIMKTWLGQQMLASIDTVLVAFGAACMFAWFFLLNPKGEQVKTKISRYSPEQEERILYHLDSLNATLLKVGGK